eukprot:6213148-Pleurochrysis_carterae.AAC.1
MLSDSTATQYLGWKTWESWCQYLIRKNKLRTQPISEKWTYCGHGAPLKTILPANEFERSVAGCCNAWAAQHHISICRALGSQCEWTNRASSARKQWLPRNKYAG